MMSMIRTLKSVLKFPMVSRARHHYTEAGRKKRELVMSHASLLHKRLAEQIKRLSVLAEEMKEAGLPANEATRIRQHLINLVNAMMQVDGIWSDCVAVTQKLQPSRTFATPTSLLASTLPDS